jgi:hypothetical protein
MRDQLLNVVEGDFQAFGNFLIKRILEHGEVFVCVQGFVALDLLGGNIAHLGEFCVLLTSHGLA